MQLPIFPAGVTEINNQIAVQKEAGRVYYLDGRLPVFQHLEQDVRSFRMFTSQLIAGGTVKPKEIVKTFGVPMVTVKRYVLEQAQQLLDETRSVPEVAAELNVLPNPLHKAIGAGRLRGLQKEAFGSHTARPTSRRRWATAQRVPWNA